MPRFFDPITKILHIIYNADKEVLPQEVADRCLKVTNYHEIGFDGSAHPRLLRRSNAVTKLDTLPMFFSVIDHRFYQGSYNLDAQHNKDLVRISDVVEYREVDLVLGKRKSISPS